MAAQKQEAAGSAVLIVAPPSQRPVLAALTDLSAAGLVAPFSWIEAPRDPEGAPDRLDPGTVEVRDGELSASTYSRLVNHHDLTRLRLLVLVPVGHPAGDALPATAEQFYQLLGLPTGVVRHSVRVMAPWSADSAPAELGRIGWEDVMISPESTADPGFNQVPWWNSPATVPGAIAVSLSVQAGIAGAVDQAPYDDAGPDNSLDLQVARSFIRVTDAHAVEDELRHQVLRLSGTFPRPNQASVGVLVAPYADPEARVGDLARAWAARHAESLRRSPVQMPVVPAESMDFLKAIGLFFSFLGRAIVGAPGAWARAVIRRAKAGVAATTTSVIFGRDSAVDVIVGGVDGSGRSVGWRDLAAAAGSASAAMPESVERSQQPVKRDFGALWQDLTTGGMALVDGSGCTNLDLGSYEGSVSDQSLIAPALSADGAFEIKEPLGDIPAGTQLRCWDQLEIERVSAGLQSVAQSQDPRSQRAAEYHMELSQWQGRNQHRLLPQVGRSLSEVFEATRGDIQRLRNEIRTLEREDGLGGDLEARQRRLGRVLAVLAFLLLGGLVVLTAMGVLGTIGWALVGAVSAVLTLVWLIVSLVIFVKGQRELFRLRYQMEKTSTRLPALLANLRMAVEDLAAQGEAYAQFDRWAGILTSFLTDPLGEKDTERTAREHETVLPAGVQRVTASADAEHLANVAAALRTDVFQAGWLTEAWQALNEQMGAYLDPDQRQLLITRQLAITAERGAEGTALSNWAQGLERGGVTSSAGARRWDRCLQILETETGPDLSLEITLPDGGTRLLSDYRQDLSRAAHKSVVQDILRARARTGTAMLTQPQYSWYRERRDGLSETMVLMAATQPIHPKDFIYPAPHDERVIHDWQQEGPGSSRFAPGSAASDSREPDTGSGMQPWQRDGSF